MIKIQPQTFSKICIFLADKRYGCVYLDSNVKKRDVPCEFEKKYSAVVG